MDDTKEMKILKRGGLFAIIEEISSYFQSPKKRKQREEVTPNYDNENIENIHHKCFKPPSA